MVHVILFSIIGLGFLTRKSGKWGQALPFVALFIFSAIRYNFGNDYVSYYNKFNLIKIGGEVFKDPLFEWLNRVSPSFQFMIFITSLAYIAVIYWLVKKEMPKEYICLSIFIFIISPYLFLMNLSSLRQCIAMLFFIVAVHFSNKKNYLLYFFFVLVAMQFHQSAVILFPFVFFANERKFDKKYVFAYLAVLAVLLTMDNFTSIIQNIASGFDDKNYLYYANNGIKNSLRATLLSGISALYVVLSLPELKGKTLMYSKLYLFSPTLAVLAIRMSSITRIQMYFDIFAIIALPLIFKHNLEKGKVEIDRTQIGKTILEILKRYVLPALILIIYLLRYYSFFTNILWEEFFVYRTIFSAGM